MGQSNANKKLILFLLLVPLWFLLKTGQLIRKLSISLLNKLVELLIFLGKLGQKNIFSFPHLNLQPQKSAKKFVVTVRSLGSFLLRTFKKIGLGFLFLLFRLKLPHFKFHLPKKTKKKYAHPGRPRSRPIFTYLFKYKYVSFFKIFQKILPSPLRIAIITSILLIIFFFYSFFLIVIARDLPSPTRLSENSGPLTTTFYDRNGEVLYRLYDDKNRTLVKLEDLPQNLVHATIAVEDQNFYKHSGFDVQGIIRSLYIYFHDHQVQGGSTITQQLIKNTLLTPERTLTRKMKEIILAFWTERIFSKNQILQMYFNEVAYGGPAWGIAAASQTYFNKSPKDLTLAESAYLAGLPASPTTYSPYGANPELGKIRQKEVLNRMVADGYITKKQADTAYAQPLTINPPISQIKAPHFVMYAKQLLAEKYGDKLVSEGGLKVYTTLDLKLQQQVEQIVSDEVDKLNYLDVSNGAAMVTDPKTGQILAMVGSKNYWDPNGGNFNVTIAPRQPGSSIKPITYASAFKLGYSPGNMILDAPISFSNAWETYAPVNYDGRFHGLVTMRTALGSSYNIPAVKTLQLVGIPNMIQTAKDMGITTFTDPDRYGLSLTLGGGEVKMVDMMSVYDTLSQMGLKTDIQPILKVVDSDGEVLEDNSHPEQKRVLDEGIAYLITSVLSDNAARTPAFGPNSLLYIPGHTVAVKTGTTDNKRDNWTFGYTPNYAIGVWVGNNDNKPMNPALTSGVTGAAPIWNDIIHKLVDGKPDVTFNRPSSVIEALVDGKKDLVVSGLQAKSLIGTPRKPQTNNIPTTSSNKDAITFTDSFSSNQDTNH